MTLKILVADDSATMRKIFEMTFAGEDARVLAVDGGDAAVAKAREVQPDVVLADLSMPGTDGYEVAQALKQGGDGNVPAVIVLASQHSPYDAERGQAAGVDDHVLKPFDTQSLIDKVKGVAAKPRAAAGAPAAAKPPGAAPPKPPAPPAGAPAATPQAAKPASPAAPAAPASPARAPAAAQAPASAATPATGSAKVGKSTMTYGSTSGAPAAAPKGPQATPPAAAPKAPQIPQAAAPKAPQGQQAAPAAAKAAPPQAATPKAPQSPQASPAGAKAAPQAAPASAPGRRPASDAAAPASAGGSGEQLAARLEGLGLTQEQIQGVLALTHEVVEQVVWEVVPDMAETLIKEEIKRLTQE